MRLWMNAMHISERWECKAKDSKLSCIMALQRELMATWVLETEMNAALQGTVTWERYKLQNQV